uniref:Uncharacterized protein n=1 Tax=Anguilla anguilla TaxID=7936 RepID=A0A0E9V280_ANGAN
MFKHPSSGLPTQLPVTHPECFRTLRDSDTLERVKQKTKQKQKTIFILKLAAQNQTL